MVSCHIEVAYSILKSTIIVLATASAACRSTQALEQGLRRDRHGFEVSGFLGSESLVWGLGLRA